MTRSTEQIVEALFGRSDLPPLEPGTKVYDQSLTKDIKNLKEDKFVIAGECTARPLGQSLERASTDHTALHLANDDIESCHLIAQEYEGVSLILHYMYHYIQAMVSFSSDYVDPDGG